MTPSETARFWEKVNKTSGCWLWTACTGSAGYGQFHISTARGRAPAHRVSWEIAHGAIPPGLWVLHRCDTPPCVNPEHLSLGTAAHNRDAMVRKGRGNYGAAGPPGAQNGWAKLGEEQAQAILTSSELGTVLAERYGVTPQTVYGVRNGTSWKHLKRQRKGPKSRLEPPRGYSRVKGPIFGPGEGASAEVRRLLSTME